MKKLITLFVAAITALVCLTSCGRTSTLNEKSDERTGSLVSSKKQFGTLSAYSHFSDPDSDTQEISINGENEESIFTFGNLPDIQELLNFEEPDELTVLYKMFVESEDYIEKRILTKKMLYILSGADKIAPDSRGENIDARDLHVIETIMKGEPFMGVDNSTYPNANAAEILNGMYAEFEELYFNLLNANTSTYSYIDYLKETQDENGNTVLDLSTFDQFLLDSFVTYTEQKEIIASMISYLLLNDYTEKKNNAEGFIAAYSDYTEDFDRMNGTRIVLCTQKDDILNGRTGKELFVCESGNDTVHANYGDDLIYGSDGNDSLFADEGNDVVYGGKSDDSVSGGPGDDILYGEEGNDSVNGDEGNDQIYAGEGDDILNGGNGNDTYIFDLGDGNDIINEKKGGGNDKIVFVAGLKVGHITVVRDDEDMILQILVSGDSIRIKKQYIDSNCMIEKLEFADGTVAHIDLDTSEIVIDVDGTK